MMTEVPLLYSSVNILHQQIKKQTGKSIYISHMET